MIRKTTTKKINDAISNGILQLTKAECYHKTSRKTEVITDSFLENLQFLMESGCFVNCVGWQLERNYKTGEYICETGRMDGDSENIVIVHFFPGDGASVEDTNKALILKEES